MHLNHSATQTLLFKHVFIYLSLQWAVIITFTAFTLQEVLLYLLTRTKSKIKSVRDLCACVNILVFTLYISFTASSIVWCQCIERFTPNNAILREQSLFQTVSFVTCSASPSITLSIILYLFLFFFLSVSQYFRHHLHLSFFTSLSNYHTNKHFSQWAIAAGLNCLNVWKKKALIHTFNLYRNWR